MALTSAEQSLDHAIRHVTSNWFPPQRDVLERVQTRLKGGEYSGQKELLLDDLKADYSLFIYSIRELLKLAQEEQNRRLGQTKQQLDPLRLFDQTPFSTLQQILLRPYDEISKHRLGEMNEAQAARIRESMLSASTAEVLAQAKKVPGEFGFSCALLRQLGICLIAWNYPRIYARAVETLTADTTLDYSLKKVLGFSPAMLGLTIARRWNLSDDFLIAMGDKKKLSLANTKTGTARKNREREASLGETLAKICEVGEAFARANDPAHYPTALADWETAQEAIATYLGPSGIQVIYERAQEKLGSYAKSAPSIALVSEPKELKEKIVTSQFSARLIERNAYLRQLPDALRQKMRSFYHRFQPNRILKSNVSHFAEELAPELGFERGCIYLFDPERNMLSPAVKVGDKTVTSYRDVKANSTLAGFDLVSSAFSLKTPLREDKHEEGVAVTTFAGALGQATRVGVLYLETSQDLTDELNCDPLVIYRALRQCLADCLNLR